MWHREHDGRVMAIGEYVDRLTGNEKVDLLGGPGESMSLGEAIDMEIHGYQEECHRLLDTIEAARRLAGEVIALGLPLAAAQKLMKMTEQWVEGNGPMLAEAVELAKSKGITIEAAGELIKVAP